MRTKYVVFGAKDGAKVSVVAAVLAVTVLKSWPVKLESVEASTSYPVTFGTVVQVAVMLVTNTALMAGLPTAPPAAVRVLPTVTKFVTLFQFVPPTRK